MIARTRLPWRHACETRNYEVGGLKYSYTAAPFPDGGPAELFLNNHKNGSSADIAAAEAAIAFSVAVQHGADAEVIRRALPRDSRGRATGPLGAALDLILGSAGA